MGIERTIRFPAGGGPDWPAVAARLAAAGESPVMRMIDGLPAFPDEVPDPGWQELRVGLAGGMVTVRRAGADIKCDAWGAADPALRGAWDRVSWAVAAAGGGEVVEPDGRVLAAGEFGRRLGPPADH